MLTFLDVADYALSADQLVLVRVMCGVVVLGALTYVRPVASAPRRERQPEDLALRIPLAETLARHRLNVDRLLAQGQRTPARFDADEFIATQQRYYAHPRLRRQRRSSMASLLQTKLITLGLLPGILFVYWGFDSVIPWSVLLAEGIFGLFLRYGCTSAMVINLLSLGAASRKAHRHSATDQVS
jgi:hypothetical protein